MQRGILYEAARKSAQAVNTVTRRHLPSVFEACRDIRMSKASIFESCRINLPSRCAGRRRRRVFVNSMSDLFHRGGAGR